MQQTKANRLFVLAFTMVLSLVFFSCSKNAQELPATVSLEKTAATETNSATNVYNSQQLWEVNGLMAVPCANNGAGEDVELKGYVHFTDHYTVNGNRFTLVSQANYNAVSGTGLSTGDKYVATGGGRIVIQGSMENGQYIAGGSEKVNLIGSGPGNNAVATFKGRIIVNANGTVTHEVVEIKIDCK